MLFAFYVEDSANHYRLDEVGRMPRVVLHLLFLDYLPSTVGLRFVLSYGLAFKIENLLQRHILISIAGIFALEQIGFYGLCYVIQTVGNFVCALALGVTVDEFQLRVNRLFRNEWNRLGENILECLSKSR